MRSSSEYIDKLNQVLSNKSNADVYIINDKLTLSVFSVLEKSLRNVRRIYLIIRDNPHLPKDEVSREFEMNPNDTLYNEYDIIEKNELTHFAKAKAMHDFIKNHVEIRKLNPRAKIGIHTTIYRRVKVNTSFRVFFTQFKRSSTCNHKILVNNKYIDSFIKL